MPRIPIAYELFTRDFTKKVIKRFPLYVILLSLIYPFVKCFLREKTI